MASVRVDHRGVASAIRAFLNNAEMVVSMAIATPLITGSIPLDQMMDMVVLGGASMQVAEQIAFMQGIHARIPYFFSDHGAGYYRASNEGEGGCIRLIPDLKRGPDVPAGVLTTR